MMKKINSFSIALVSVFLIFGAQKDLSANPLTEEDIIRALQKKSDDPNVKNPKFRSLEWGDKKRGITVTEAAKKPPSISLKVNFAYNSDVLENEALLTLKTLGNALSSDALKGQTIEIIGHTDARGTDEYNDDLSQRRAASVVSHLVAHYGLDSSLVSSRGMGERELLDPANPEGELNRRVEIRNITQ